MQLPFRIGVVGYNSHIDDTVVEELLHDAIGIIDAGVQGQKIEIVAGLIDAGTNKVAYRVAENLGYGTGGVACSLAEYHPEAYACDWKKIILGSPGVETDAFVSSIDALVRVGGDEYARQMARMAQERGVWMVEYDFPWIRSLR